MISFKQLLLEHTRSSNTHIQSHFVAYFLNYMGNNHYSCQLDLGSPLPHLDFNSSESLRADLGASWHFTTQRGATLKGALGEIWTCCKKN